MVAVFVCDDVLLGQRPTAGTELVFENLEEVGVEIRGVVRRAERAHVTVGGATSGADLTPNSFIFGRR